MYIHGIHCNICNVYRRVVLGERKEKGEKRVFYTQLDSLSLKLFFWTHLLHHHHYQSIPPFHLRSLCILVMHTIFKQQWHTPNKHQESVSLIFLCCSCFYFLLIPIHTALLLQLSLITTYSSLYLNLLCILRHSTKLKVSFLVRTFILALSLPILFSSREEPASPAVKLILSLRLPFRFSLLSFLLTTSHYPSQWGLRSSQEQCSLLYGSSYSKCVVTLSPLLSPNIYYYYDITERSDLNNDNNISSTTKVYRVINISIVCVCI